MKNRRWALMLGIGVPLFICLYLATCGVAGFVLGTTTSNEVNAREIAGDGEGTLVVPTRVLRPPQPVEAKTARIVAGAELPERDLLDLARRLQGMPESDWQPPVNPPPYVVGDSLTFWVHDVRTNSYSTSTASLAYETPHAYWWVEDGFEIDADDLEQSAENFQNISYPTSQRLFGSEWNPGVDGDPHVFIYLGNVPGVGGYFSGPDEYPVSVRPHSNQHEMFYINLHNAGPGNDYFDGVLAHELQHMIHWAQDRNERTWVNEGLSELSADAGGYDVGGSDYAFVGSPDTQLTTWTDLEDSAPHYGASYLFLAYFADQFGEEAVRQLVEEQADGIAGFETVLASLDPDRDFDQFFADWVVANYLDDPDLARRYGYSDLRIEQPETAARYRDYPASEAAAVHQYAADYIVLDGRGDLTVEFTGTQLVPLIGNETRTGDYQWWSNRGDDGDARLTRAFDLTGLDSATLEAWMWYNLEVDYDYGYVAVSTDDGETWQLLASEHTTTDNPSGNSYGPALTGLSGGAEAGEGSEAEWSLETFDLTPYAGQPVLIRFEVITDEALNRPGLAVDGISIPELGYEYDPDEGDGDWLAEGWLRVSDHVPQGFILQLITFDGETIVQRIPLDEDNRARFRLLGLGKEIDSAVLVVSAVAPATTEWAAYTYSITPD